MLQATLVFAVIVAVITILLRLGIHWASGLVTGDLRYFLKAGETIIEHEQIPDAWLKPHRARLAAMRRAGADDQALAGLGEKARAHCLREFDKVIYFFQRTRVTDTPETQRKVMDSLREQRARWASAQWQDLLEPESAHGAIDSAGRTGYTE